MHYEPSAQKRRLGLSPLIIGLMLSMVLLSACGTNASSRTTVQGEPTTLNTPAVNDIMKGQGDTQLQTFQQWIDLLKQYKGDATTYQQQLQSDQQALQNAGSAQDYQNALNSLKNHVEAIKLPAMKAETGELQQQLTNEVATYGKQHIYQDSYNNQTYPMALEYGPLGSGGLLSAEMSSAKTLADYQQTVEDEQIYLTNFAAYQADAQDKTPFNQPHKVDQQLMQHYDMTTTKKVILISLSQQAMRVYQNGKLIKSFKITSGRPDHPSLAGSWWVEGKKSPTVFKAGVPKTDPAWYPDTPIKYAIQYHSNGYFVHSSPWRIDYGPGTNFPHADTGGDAFAANGSHGCVNMPEADTGWLYNFVTIYTPIVIF